MTAQSLSDPIVEGLARGWRVFGGSRAMAPATLECDVAIVGSGAGAGITAGRFKTLPSAAARSRFRTGLGAQRLTGPRMPGVSSRN